MKELLEFAQKQAKRAGKILLDHFGRLENIRLKKDDSLVTEADMRSEQFIRKAIGKNYPTHQILGEEEGFDQQDTEFTWVIDPLDGTTNFASGVPLFAVSIGLFRKENLF